MDHACVVAVRQAHGRKPEFTLRRAAAVGRSSGTLARHRFTIARYLGEKRFLSAWKKNKKKQEYCLGGWWSKMKKRRKKTTRCNLTGSSKLGGGLLITFMTTWPYEDKVVARKHRKAQFTMIGVSSAYGGRPVRGKGEREGAGKGKEEEEVRG
jgi:hypothetical protein